MEYQTNPYLALQLLSAMITFGLGLYIQTRPQKKRESNAFSVLMFGGAIWSFGNAMQWFSPNLFWQLIWNTISYAGIVIIPTAWFLLAVKFTGYWRNFIEKWEYLFWLAPTIIYFSILTNPFHKLFFTSNDIVTSDGFVTLKNNYGVLFYVHTYYSYILMFLGLLFIGHAIITKPKSYGSQLYGLIIGVLAPLVGNIFYLTESFPVGFPDPTPIMFTITGVAFAWAIFGGRMLEAVSIAHEQVVEELTSGILILDLENRILSINPAAVQILDLQDGNIQNRSILELLRDRPEFLDTMSESLTVPLDHELKLKIRDQGNDRTYQLLISGIRDQKDNYSGRLLQFSDISRRTQAEENLATTQQTFESVLESLQDSYFEANPEGIITYANKALVNNLGFTDPQLVIGHHFKNFTRPEFVREIFEKFSLLYQTRQPLKPFEYNYRTKDGKLFIGETVVSPIMDGNRILGSRGIIRDITPRVKAEREISEQRDLLHSLLQHAPLGIVINDLENKITVVNPAFENLFGYAQDEVAGKDLDDILSTPEIFEEMRNLTNKGLDEQIHFVGKRKVKDGTLIDVEIFSEPFYIGAEKYGLLVFYNDISERLRIETDLKRTQSTYISVLDTLQDFYFELEPTGIITYVNHAFVKNTRHLNKEEIIGKHFRHVMPRKSFRPFVENFKKLYKTAAPLAPFEFVYRTKDGTEFTSEIVVSPIIENGIAVGARGMVRDISVRVKAEQILTEAKNAAEHRAGELAAINRIATIVNRSLDLDEILQAVCVEFTQIFPVRNTGIALLTDDQTHLEVKAFHTISSKEESARGLVLDLEENSASQKVIKNKNTVVIQDAQTDPRTKPIHELTTEHGSRSFLIVPLVARGNPIGTIGMPAKEPMHIFTDNEIELAETMASQITAAVENARLYSQTEMALDVAERDLEIGREIQSGFFPETVPDVPGWEIAAHFQAARQVAGDFYDIFQFRNSNLTAFIIVDVCDKGVGAALFMVLIRSLLRAFSETFINANNVQERLKEIVIKTNNFIAEFHGQSNMFATMFFGILDPDRGTLYYINGGHEPPIMINSDGVLIQRLMPSGPAVGMFPDMVFKVEQIQLDEGDILVGFTDGATDAKNIAGELFSEERLLDSIQAPWTSIFSMVFELYTELRNHIGGQGQYDDITLISLRRKQTMGSDYHAICRVAIIDILGELRDFVESAATQSGLSPDDAFAFKLASEEICANIIQYGYEGQEPGYIAIAFEKKKDKAILKIWDDGKYFSPDQADTPNIDADWDERQIGGLGMYFVNELMDHVSYNKDNNNTNVLVLEKYLSTD